MDLFYRGYDPNARITSAAKHLSAAAARFAVSVVRSVPHLPEATWQEVKRLLTVDALWSLCLVLAGWLIATVVGGLIALAVNALLVVYGLVELWKPISEVAGDLKAWALAAYQAHSDAELDAAAVHFAEALSKGGITVLEVVVTHRVFRAVEGRLRQRFPRPEWLETQYEEAAQKRETTRSVSTKTVEAVASGARYEGAKRAADEVPTAAFVLGGAVLAIGTAAVATWALRPHAHGRQP
ncbi:MAG: hypothetical protein U1A78_33500 [Polyangia bacterium]